jgi:hypothetical protein
LPRKMKTEVIQSNGPLQPNNNSNNNVCSM